MAITKKTENDKIEILKRWIIQVRQATTITENGAEIAKTYHRVSYVPFSSHYDSDKKTWTHTDTDISKLDADVKAICVAAWTDEVKDDYKKWMETEGLPL